MINHHLYTNGIIYLDSMARLLNARKCVVIPNHEYRVFGLGQKYGFGTPALVTPKLKTHVKALFGNSMMDTTLYRIVV